MSLDLGAYLRTKGYENIKIPQYASNPVAQRTAIIEALMQQSLGKGIDGKDIFINERQANILYNELFDKEGRARLLGKNNHKDYLNAFKNDILRNKGEYTFGAGIDTTTGYGFSGNRLMSRKAHLAAGITDSGRLIKEGFMNSFMIPTKNQWMQMKAGGWLTKVTTAAQPLLGGYMLGSELLSGGDVSEALATSAMGTAGIVGFNLGKSFAGFGTKSASIVNGKIVGGYSRLALQGMFGVAGGVTGAGLVAAGYYGTKDMLKSDSAIAKASNSYAKAKAFGNVQQTQPILTMRQKALQQLSQSSINDRASVLGNEAAILKNLL